MIVEVVELKYTCKIYVDDEYIGVVRKRNLEKFKNFNSLEELKKQVLEEEYESAKNKVLRQLNFSSKTEFEVVKKLKNDNFQEYTINRIINFLNEYNLINDVNFAQIYTDSLKNSKNSRRKIKNILTVKGIDDEIVEESINGISDEEEFANALDVGKKKVRLLKGDDKYKKAQKLKQYLLYKGFNYDTSDKVVKVLFAGELD